MTGLLLHPSRPARRTEQRIRSGIRGGLPLAVLTVLAWMIAIGAFVLPPSGIGVVVCPSQQLFGVDCHGCGLTRSVCCTAHGQIVASWQYHPFGIVVFIGAIGIAALSVTPCKWRQSMRQALGPTRRVLRRLAYSLAAAFVIFGSVRMIISIVDRILSVST